MKRRPGKHFRHTYRFGRFRIVSDRFGRFSDRFGPFRIILDGFRTVSDGFRPFRTVFGPFRIISDGFRIVSDRFRIVSDEPIFFFQISNFNWPGLGPRRAEPRRRAEPGPSPGQLKFEICLKNRNGTNEKNSILRQTRSAPRPGFRER